MVFALFREDQFCFFLGGFSRYSAKPSPKVDTGIVSPHEAFHGLQNLFTDSSVSQISCSDLSCLKEYVNIPTPPHPMTWHQMRNINMFMYTRKTQ